MEDGLNGDCLIHIVTCYATILSDDTSTRVRELRLAATKELQAYLALYQEKGYDQKLIDTIARKKCELINTITSKGDMDKLIRPRCPYFDGNKFVPDELIIPEEELICWSQASLNAPLNSFAFDRYVELFKNAYPEKSKEIFGTKEGT